MEAKKYLYAAVGAQVAVVRSAQAKLEDLVSKVNENATSASTDMKGRIEVWAGEGEEFLGKVTDTKTIDDLTSKVDFDQVQSQVNRLRDQLEDLVATWRSNFRPESAGKSATEVPARGASPTAAAQAAATAQPAATKPAATKPAAKKPAAKASAAKQPAAKPAAKSASKASTAKPTSTQKPTSQAS